MTCPPLQSSQLLDSNNVLSLGTFLTVGDGELYCLAFCQRLESVTSNCTEVCKNVGTRLLLNKTKTFRFVEPLNGSLNSFRHNINHNL
jgi:hypothetical protein